MCAGMEDASRWGEGFTGRVPSTQWEISVGVRLDYGSVRIISRTADAPRVRSRDVHTDEDQQAQLPVGGRRGMGEGKERPSRTRLGRPA